MLKFFKKIISSYSRLAITRHGETQSNKNKQWSGWSDSKLSSKGEEESVRCGMLFKQEKIEFDVAFASMLTRSIKTLNIILGEMGMDYIPVHKRWELNQKFYGALQGLDKLKIVQQYGQQMVEQWRRSFTIAPPKVFPEDIRHPIHDKRYKWMDPSILPNTESLGDVHLRVAKLYQRQIKPLLQDGKNILIVCHGSNVRAFSHILLGFDMQKSRKFKVPNAIPLLIDFQKDMSVKQWRFLGDKIQIENKMDKLDKQLKRQ